MRLAGLVVALILAHVGLAHATVDLQVRRGNTTIAKDSTDNIGGLSSMTYTVVNNGTTTGTITNGVDVPSSMNAVCNVTTQPTTLVPAGGSTTFAISIGSASGAFTCSMRMFSDDPASPFSFTIAGDPASTSPDFEIAGPEGFITAPGAGEDQFPAAPGTSVARSFAITNAGTGTLDLTVSVPSTELCDCQATVTPGSIGAGEAAELEVTVTPRTSGVFRCNVQLVSNDPQEGVFAIVLTNSAIPNLSVVRLPDRTEVPADSSFEIGLSRQFELELGNHGGTPLSVSARIDPLSPPSCRLTTDLPTSLLPGTPGFVTLDVDAEQAFQCTIVLDSNDPLVPEYRVSIVGRSTGRRCSVGGEGTGLLALVLAGLLLGRRRRPS